VVRRYLTWLEAVSALDRGKAVEQLLPAQNHDGLPTVRWLTVYRPDAFVVAVHHVYDPCDPEFLDVSAFAPVDENEDNGAGIEIGRASDPEQALRIAGGSGAAPERWVNQFVVAEEYRDAHGWT
jgi:hypothetical protein